MINFWLRGGQKLTVLWRQTSRSVQENRADLEVGPHGG